MMKKILPYAAGAAMTLGLVSPALAISEPVVQAVGQTTATVNVPIIFTTTYTDAEGVASCSLWVNDDNKGSATLTGPTTAGTATVSYTFSATGSYQIKIRCLDTQGNAGVSNAATVNVSANSTTATVGAVSPVSANLNTTANYSASFSNISNLSSCSLYADGNLVGTMTLSSSGNNGTASSNYTFVSSGSHTLQVRCTDNSGNIISGPSTTVTVAGQTSNDTTAPAAPTNLKRTSIGSDKNTVGFNWNASTDNVGVAAYQVSIDNGAYISTGLNTNYMTATLASGNHTISVRAIDAAGNVSSTTSLSFTIPGELISGPPFLLDILFGDVSALATANSRAELESRSGRTCELTSTVVAARVMAVLGTITDTTVKAQIENFVACGTPTTLHLGAGERLGAVNSFRAAFGRLPSSQDDWYDVVKIANGRFPGHTSVAAESRAKASFKIIYLRDPNMSATGDNNAVNVMAYGLRPLPRNLSSEAAAIVSFRATYGRGPVSASDWDIVRAIAYSGASR